MIQTWRVVGALLSLLLPAASFGADHQDEFRFRVTEDLGTLDWGYGEVTASVVTQLMEGLTVGDADGRPEPALAKSWKWQTPTRLVLQIDPAAKWSDGKPVCAQQFVDAWSRVRDPKFASPYAHYLRELRAYTAKGCHELVIDTFRRADHLPALLAHWVFFPVRAELIQAHPKDWFRPPHLLVTGPYLLKEWKPDQVFALEANPQYFRGKLSVPRARAIVVREDATARTLWEQGRLDWWKDLPVQDRKRLRNAKGYHSRPTHVGYHLGFRVDTTDREGRCALAAALGKKEIPEILEGEERPAWHVLPPELGGEGARAEFDPARARELWEKSPWGARVRAGEKLTMAYYSKNIHQPLMEWAQQQWKKHLGLSVSLEKVEAKAYWARLQSDPYTVFLSGTTAAYGHARSFLSEFLLESPSNWGHFRSVDFKRAVDENDNRLAQSVLVERECAIIPLYFRSTAWMESDRFEGAELNALNVFSLRGLQRRGGSGGTK